MLLKAYRFTVEEGMLRNKIFSMHQAPTTRSSQALGLVRAYETPELAAFCSPEWLANDKRKTIVVRETITMPQDPGLHETMELEKPWLIGDEDYLTEQMRNFLSVYRLLSVWAPSPYAPQQHVVLLNTQHPAYGGVHVSSRRITVKKSSGVLQSEEAIAEV